MKSLELCLSCVPAFIESFALLYSSAHNLSPLPEDSHIQKTRQQLTGCLATTVLLKIWGQKGVVQLKATDEERLGQVIVPALCGRPQSCSGVWCMTDLQSPCEGWPAELPTLPQECCLFPNIPSTLPLRDGPMVKSRDVVVLKPNSVCQVHPKCWERKIRRDTCRCWTVNGGCKMAQCKMLPLLFTITNEQTEQKSEESNFWVAISVA